MRLCLLPLALAALLTSGCGQSSGGSDAAKIKGPRKFAAADADYKPSILTRDIQAGIEQHIADESKKGGGYFVVPFENSELKLRLVRVHLEYLASLAPTRHFACVDMVGSDNQFYDIDFFMEGETGSLKVTDTLVHKRNGQPFYVWKLSPENFWVQESVDDATEELLGVLVGKDTFEFRYQATLPQLDGAARCWLPIVQSDNYQTVALKSMDVSGKSTIIFDQAYSNKVLFLELDASHSGTQIEIVYDVTRLEKESYDGDPEEAKLHLLPERMVPSDDKITAIARKAIAGKEGDLAKARALYDYVIDNMLYQKQGEGWGQGDALRACDALSGNCTDYHSLFIGLARSVGIPARFAVGAAIPSERHDGGTDGYHCWAEFHAEGKWWPVDISEADKFCSLSMYYFGHHPANRVEFTRGRDLTLEPGPAAGPINFLAYPYLEIKGEQKPVATMFLFRRKS